MAVRPGESSSPPQTPDALGPYRCIRKLAVGGMGEVYLAEARGAGNFSKRLVIKAVRADRAEEQEVIQAFLDEARVWALLTHPNIVPLFDCAWLGGRLCLVMEYVEGADLRELIQSATQLQRAIPASVAIHLLAQLAAALHAAHEARGTDGKHLGIVHRDVSPHNVLVDRQGNARLCDFGIARSALRLSRTRSGRFKGKFAYVSPEAIRGEKVDRRADVFGMGILLYELLALRRPFQADGPVALLRTILDTEPAPLIETRPDVSVQLCQVIERAIAKDATQRFATAEAFRLALLRTPEGGEKIDQQRLISWFDALTGASEDYSGVTQPRLLDLAARSAARSLDEDIDVDIQEPSFQSISSVSPPLSPPLVPPKLPPTETEELTAPAAAKPRPRAQPLAAPQPPTSPTLLKAPALPATHDMSSAPTVVRGAVTVEDAAGVRRQLIDYGPWIAAGVAGGGAIIWMLSRLL